MLANQTKVAGAEKDGEFIRVVGIIERIMETKTGVSTAAQIMFEQFAGVAIVAKIVGGKVERDDVAILDHVQRYWRLK